MAVHFYKVIWYWKNLDKSLRDGVDLTDAVDWNLKKGVKARAASFEINLKNNWKDLILTSGDRTNLIKIQPDDEMKIYADINPITESSAQLIMTGTVMGFQSKLGGKKRNIKIKCSDKSQIVLSRVWSKVEPNKTAPAIITDVLKQVAQDQDDGTFGIDTTNVQTTRPITSGGGGDAYPAIDFAKNMKPVYEWIDELSQVEYTNKDSEQSAGGSLVCQRAHVWYLDEANNFYWFYPTDSTDYTIQHGVDRIFGVDLKRDIFDVINMVIVRGGKDKQGGGITWYYYDSSTASKELRVKVIPKPKIADSIRQILIEEDGVQTTLDGAVDATDTTITLTSTAGMAGAGTVRINTEMVKYGGTAGDDLTGCKRGSFGTFPGTHADGDTVDEASAYGDMSNSDFRARVKTEIKAVGKNITTRYGAERWRGNIELSGSKYTPGELIDLTVKDCGCINELLRIIDVHHQMTKKGWFTTLKLEEDETLVGN